MSILITFVTIFVLNFHLYSFVLAYLSAVAAGLIDSLIADGVQTGYTIDYGFIEWDDDSLSWDDDSLSVLMICGVLDA